MGLELGRRFFHVAGSVFPGLYLLELLTYQQLRWLTLAGAGLAVVLETARLYGGFTLPIYQHNIRSYEDSNPAAYALYVISGTLVIWVFEPMVAIPAVLMLTIADPISGMLSDGGLEGVKSPLVLATTFLVCLGIGLALELPLLAAIAAAAVVTVADGVPIVVAGYVIDDNLTIAPAAAVAIWLMFEITI